MPGAVPGAPAAPDRAAGGGQRHRQRRAHARDYEVNLWSGIIALAGLPRAILDRLNRAVNASIAAPGTKERFEQLGSEGGGAPEEFAELIRRDSARWAEVVRRSGARID